MGADIVKAPFGTGVHIDVQRTCCSHCAIFKVQRWLFKTDYGTYSQLHYGTSMLFKVDYDTALALQSTLWYIHALQITSMLFKVDYDRPMALQSIIILVQPWVFKVQPCCSIQ